MERDSDTSDSSSSSDGTIEENADEKRFKLIQEVFNYADFHQRLLRGREELFLKETQLLQLRPDFIFGESTNDYIPPSKMPDTCDELSEEVEKVKEAMETDQIKIAILESIISDILKNQISQTNWENIVPPMVLPINEPQHSSGDTQENLPNAPILPETLQLPEFIHDSNEAFLKVQTKESDISSQKTPIKFQAPESPPVSPIQNRQDTSDPNTPQDFTFTEETYDGKGKQAANPKFRYKKKLTPEVSPIEVRSQKNPSEIASGSPGLKPRESPNTGIARISPAINPMRSPSTTVIARISPRIKTLETPSPTTGIARISPVVQNPGSPSTTGIARISPVVQNPGSPSTTGITRISPVVQNPGSPSTPDIARISAVIQKLGSSPTTGIVRTPPAIYPLGSPSPNSGTARISPALNPLESPSTSTGIARISPMMKALGSSSPNTTITGISPLKRKDVESDESRSALIPKSSGYPADCKDDSTIAKKLKFDDDEEKASKQCPIIAELLSQKSCEQAGSSGFVGQIPHESEQLTKGFTKVIIHSSSEGSSPDASGNEEVPSSETGGSFFPSDSDILSSDIDDSSITSVSDLSNDAKK